MDGAEDFEHRISRLGCELFDGIDGISSNDDRKSWLALQRAVRDSKTQFVYLEVGSYLGGSIQQYLLDPKCSRIYSIDKRPTVTPDGKDETRSYADNSLVRTIENLRAVAPDELHKLVCFDTDARDVDPALMRSRTIGGSLELQHSSHEAAGRASNKYHTVSFRSANLIPLSP